MKQDAGFTLVEVAIVVVIIGLLLGGLLMPLASQVEQHRISETQKLLDEVREALIGFAIINDRLPCPATPVDAGFENPGCTVQFGFVPAVTLGLGGSLNQDRLLLDAWGNPIRYSVTTSDGSAFTTVNGMRNRTMQLLTPNLVVCTTSILSTAADCAPTPPNPQFRLTVTAVAVLFSMGKNWATPGSFSADETANLGNSIAGGPSGTSYALPSDRVFVNRTYSTATGNGFDDIVIWLTPAILYNRMVAAGRLP